MTKTETKSAVVGQPTGSIEISGPVLTADERNAACRIYSLITGVRGAAEDYASKLFKRVLPIKYGDTLLAE